MEEEIQKILRGLQNTMTVMEALERRNADRLQDHQEWLEALNKGWARHEAAWKRHEEWLESHERAMAEFDIGMNNLRELITRFIQGRNVN
jgi:hypothetical protein